MQTDDRTEATDSTSAGPGPGPSDAGGILGASAKNDLKISEGLAVSSEMKDGALTVVATEKFRYICPLSREIHVLVRQHGLQVLDFTWLKENGCDLAYRLGGSRFKIEDIAEELGLKDAMEKYERNKLLTGWKALVDEHGLNVYKQKWLQDNKLTQLLTRSKRRGLRLIDVAKELGDDIKLAKLRKEISNNGGTRWSAQKFDEVAREVIDRFGCIPSGGFLQNQGYGGFHWQFKVYGPVQEIRRRYNVEDVRLCDIDGNALLSLPEVCFANYMLARNIKVEQGDQYPAEYAMKYDRARGVYDFHFVATEGLLAGKRISVEIFGGGRACGDEKSKKKYEETKRFKLDFHKENELFLALEFDECYADETLTKRLKSYIGHPPVVRFHELIKLCPTTQLSQVDVIMNECKAISARMPDGSLPSTDWFQLSRQHENRERYEWEPHRWAGFLTRLRRIGMAAIREALGQEQIKPIKWTFDRFLDELSIVVRAGFATPSQASFQTEKELLRTNKNATKILFNRYKRLQRIWYKFTTLPQTARSTFLLCTMNNSDLTDKAVAAIRLNVVNETFIPTDSD